MVRRAVLILFILALAAVPGRAQESGSGDLVYRVPVTGTIELGLAPFVTRSIDEARNAGASAVVLDVDTPGGRVDAAQRIADAVQDAGIPVYAFINRRALSAGALVSLATDRIFMLPGSVIGAATPVDGSGERAPEKIVSAMRSEMRALAAARGLDPAVAEAMVDESLEIAGVVESGRLLTLTAEEAAAVGYATTVASWNEALGQLDLAGARIREMETNWAERMVRFLTNPVVAPFLLSLGFLGLLVEIKSPGLGLPGAAGAVALALFFGSHHLLGLAGMTELLLLGAGLVLVGLEVFVIPGFGVFGILGALGILGGIYLSLLGALPTTPDYARAATVLAATFLLVAVGGWALVRTLPASGRLARSGVFLLTGTDREAGYESAERRPELVGARGTAATDLRPSGTGLFDGERLDVVSDAGWIEEGSRIRIVSAEGYRHVVRPVSGEEAGGAPESGPPGDASGRLEDAPGADEEVGSGDA